MPKRLTDTEIWDKVWFRKLRPKYKCFIRYLFDRCDNAGIWQVDLETAEYYVGAKLDLGELESILNGHVKSISSNKWFVVDFIEFQYNCTIKDLNPKNNAHLSVIRKLKKYDIKVENSEGLARSCLLLLDKDKDMDKDMDKDKDKDLYIQRIKKFFNNPPAEWLAEIKQCYPDIDFNKQWREMKAWLISHPNNQKKLFKRFVNNWLKNAKPEQKRGQL